MSDQQLREAFSLMKEGKKQEAIAIVRDVLRDDMENISAWLLLANLLDDETKKQKAVERVLHLRPDHPGALKLLAKKPTAKFPTESKKKRSEYDWSKLEKQKNIPSNPQAIRLAAIGIFGGLALIGVAIIGVVIAWFSINVFNHDINGASPDDVVMAFVEAMMWEDFARMRSLSCPGYQDYVNAMEQGFYASNRTTPSDLVVDLSDVTTERVRLERNVATIVLHGEVVISRGGERIVHNFDDGAREHNVDGVGQHVNRIDGIWMVCEGPDFIFWWE